MRSGIATHGVTLLGEETTIPPISTSTMMFSSSTLYLLPTLFIPGLFAANCYRPDGELVTDPSYVPCNQAAADTGSMCCALNRSSYPDQCLSNGLCGGGGNIFRDSCTDPTWKSPMCLQLCTTGFGPSGTAVGLSEG
ncbi:MAG: hypothetical protein LQ345_004046 [Seirophora villosa]|nr:MAG: hypothetical protein LQ345_004046 [Seirophora villosa]